ncbi:MAG: general stress protein CsbD [Saprospiraceae bacterium]|nr:general stress protein CsbD [Saprospiraceae bacterium]
MKAPTTTPTPVKASWADQKAKLKVKFPALVDSDLIYEDGKKNEMLTKIQVKLGKTPEELTAIISAL